MKNLLLVLAIMAGSLNAQISYQDKLVCVQLANDLESFDRQIPYDNHDELYDFFCDNEPVMISFITRINTVLAAYPDYQVIQGFIPLRDNLQSALDQIRNMHSMAAPSA